MQTAASCAQGRLLTMTILVKQQLLFLAWKKAGEVLEEEEQGDDDGETEWIKSGNQVQQCQKEKRRRKKKRKKSVDSASSGEWVCDRLPQLPRRLTGRVGKKGALGRCQNYINISERRRSPPLRLLSQKRWHNNTAIIGDSTNNTVKPTEISQYLSLHNSIAKLHFPIMASHNEEALHGHVTKVGPNHWTVTVSHGSLLPWNSIMAPINSEPGRFPLSWIWHIWISAAEGGWRGGVEPRMLKGVNKSASNNMLTRMICICRGTNPGRR